MLWVLSEQGRGALKGCKLHTVSGFNGVVSTGRAISIGNKPPCFVWRVFMARFSGIHVAGWHFPGDEVC